MNLFHKIFMDLLANWSGKSEKASYYHTLFRIQPHDDLEAVLKWVYDEYKDPKNNKDYWFYAFHKSVRQTDFFTGCSVTWTQSTLTQEEQNERQQMVDQMNGEWKKVTKKMARENDWTPYSFFRSKYPEKYERYLLLTRKKNNKEQRSIGGHLDCLLWDLISNDDSNVLMSIMLRTFKSYDMEMQLLSELSEIEKG